MIRVSRDYEALCRDVVEHLLSLTKQTKGRFVLALSGGSTPQGIYALMGKAPYKNQFPRKKIHFFWGDERWVSRHHPENNYRNARRLLFSRIKIPRQNIHPINTHADRPVFCQ